MSVARPPARQPTGTPVVETLPAGTTLHRVHRNYPAESFNPTPQPSALHGGRFDCLDGSFAYTYVGEGPAAAIAETLCRGLLLDGTPRMVSWAELEGRSLSTLTTTRDLPVLALHGAALTQVGAPLSLTKSEAREYRTTRAWAHALRAWLPDIAGFRYRCRHDEDLMAYVLFDDGPAPAGPRARGALSVVPGTELTLSLPEGEDQVLRVLRQHNATLSPRPIPRRVPPATRGSRLHQDPAGAWVIEMGQ